MAPPSLGISSKGIPLDFSVNSLTPICNAVLLSECGRLNPCAKGLIILVRRWAKDRGICHAAKGHLAPYAWTLLAVYFLQVGASEGPLLPPLQGFKGSGPAAFGVRRSSGAGTAGPEEGKERPIGDLFKQFIRFYSQLNWKNEAVSVRSGLRAPAPINLMLHIIVHEDQRTEVGPNIEDPFDPARNLGFSVTPLGMQRFHEEFSRASALLEGNDLSLTVLLEPWAPPAAPGAQGTSSNDGTDGGEPPADDGGA
jgi:DNA polymerase sigma